MKPKWNLIVDVAGCSNCGNCTLAVKDEYVGNDFPGYSAAQPDAGHKWFWVDRIVRGSGSAIDVAHIPKACNHCDEAPCIKAAPDAVSKRNDGIVIIDPNKAFGRKELVDACPYGAISWNANSQLPQIWTFDAHLLDSGWTAPRVTQVCPTGCLNAMKVTDEEMGNLAQREDLKVLKPTLRAKPRIYYKNLWRAEEHFVAGNVVKWDKNGQLANVVGIEVCLLLNEKLVRTARTNDFGDFKFDQIAKGNSFELSVSTPEGKVCVGRGVVDESLNLGSLSCDTPWFA